MAPGPAGGTLPALPTLPGRGAEGSRGGPHRLLVSALPALKNGHRRAILAPRSHPPPEGSEGCDGGATFGSPTTRRNQTLFPRSGGTAPGSIASKDGLLANVRLVRCVHGGGWGARLCRAWMHGSARGR